MAAGDSMVFERLSVFKEQEFLRVREILKRADAIPLRVLNPGAPESAVEEGELFSELEGLEDVEADEK